MSISKCVECNILLTDDEIEVSYPHCEQCDPYVVGHIIANGKRIIGLVRQVVNGRIQHDSNRKSCYK